MSSYNTWISIKNIIQDYINKSAHQGNLNEELVYIGAEEGVDALITGDNFGEYVVLLNLYNQKAALPSNFKYPTQVGYRPPSMPEPTPANDLRRYFLNTLSTECIEEVHLDACQSCKQTTCCCEEKEWYPIATDANYVKLSKHPQLATGYSKFMYGVQDAHRNTEKSVTSALSHTTLNTTRAAHERKVHRPHEIPNFFSKVSKCPEFQMVRPASNYFFNLPGLLKHCNVPAYDTNLEYRIDDGVIMLNNYEYKCKRCTGCIEEGECNVNPPIEPQGQVLISYLGSKIDDEGFLMIPNEKYIIKALSDYIVAYMARIAYAEKMDQKTGTYFGIMQGIADKSMIQARSRFRIPSPDKWDHFIKNIWLKQLRYKNYKENLNRWQEDQYQLPDESYLENRGHYRDSFSSGSNNYR